MKETTENDIKTIETFDPQFAVILKKKKEIDLKVYLLEKQIADEKINTEAKVSLLRDDFENKRELLKAQAKEAKSLIDPEKKAIKDKIVGMSEEVKPKAERLKSIELMLKDTISLLEKSKDTNINLQEKEKWDKQIYTLEKEKEKVTKDIEMLKEKIRLFEMELRILR
ncbi:MAG: hypothetical protein NTZ48_01610 [Candidatus Omnitrophica bacterium]|nr:hypothetical protein [Candidatus Omnitrophota bacterium]